MRFPGFHKIYIVLTAVLLSVFSSCCEKGTDVTIDRTMLVYIAGDNNLSIYINGNINDMTGCMDAEVSGHNNLLAFVDKPYNNSFLLRIHDQKVDTVRMWDINLNSSSPEVLSMVIDYVVKEYPAESYGLLLWSHGTGWAPSSAHRYIDERQLRVPERTGSSDMNDLSGIRRPFDTTRALLADEGSGNMDWMDIDELPQAIPDSLFDFIMFDACLMSSAEVVYGLQRKAKWIIASAVEIMANGFPYWLVTPYFFNADYVSLCREYYDYYNSQSGIYKTAGIALIETAQFHLVTEAFRNVVDNATVSVSDIDLWQLQRCDRFRRPVMFDMMSVAEALRPGVDALVRLNDALDHCLRYLANTEYVVSELRLNEYCGFNCFAPIAAYDGVLNPLFAETEWNRATGLLKID